MTTHIARDLTYSYSAASAPGRAMIRVIENMTGRRRLMRRARGYDMDVAAGQDFWSVMAARCGLQLEVVGRSLADIPRDGPLVIVSNHPYGILDGLMMGKILKETRGDFRILAHEVFRRAPDLSDVILPIDFSANPEAVATNIATRKTALDYLGQGGAIGIFPGGTVSTPARPFGPAMDPAWRGFTARLIARSNATVVPVFFEGQNSRLFHLASHLNTTLRMSLLIREFSARVDGPVRAVIGPALKPARVLQYGSDPKSVMDFLRQQTYALSPDPLDWQATGFEFEDFHRA